MELVSKQLTYELTYEGKNYTVISSIDLNTDHVMVNIISEVHGELDPEGDLYDEVYDYYHDKLSELED